MKIKPPTKIGGFFYRIFLNSKKTLWIRFKRQSNILEQG